jgi:peptidyl-prolyl cis-trans isomerase D
MSIMWIKNQAKWIIVGAAVLVAFGLIMMDRQGAYRSGFHGNYVGSVDGEELQTGAFQQDLQNYIRSEEQKTGKAPDGQQLAQARDNLFQTKVVGIIIQKQFKAYQLHPSVEEMQAYLVNSPREVAYNIARYEGPDRVPSFLRDSTFDPSRFQSWLLQDSVYDRIGMRVLEDQLKTSVIPQLQLQQLLRCQVHRTDLEEEFALETRENLGRIVFYQVPFDAFPVPLSKFSDADLKAHFEANPDSFYHHDEAVSLKYVRLPIRPSPKDSALMRDFAAELKQRAATGEKFADLAKSYSNDPGSADSGGRLGGFQPRTTWVAEFSQAAFNLEPGQISDPVLTQFGYHIILMNAKSKKGDSVDVSHILLKITAGTETTDSLSDLAEKIKNEAEKSGLEAAAKDAGLLVQSTPVFEKGVSPSLPAYLQGVQSFAFSAHEKKAKISDVLQNEEGIYLFERDKHFDKGRDFERAREAIARDLARKEQMELVRKEIETDQPQITALTDPLPPTIGKATLDSSRLIPVESYVPGFGYASGELLKAFHQKQGEWGSVLWTSNAAVIAKLVESQPGDPAAKAQKAHMAVVQGDVQMVSDVFKEWIAGLPKTVKVENNLDMMYRN